MNFRYDNYKYIMLRSESILMKQIFYINMKDSYEVILNIIQTCRMHAITIVIVDVMTSPPTKPVMKK